VGNNVEKNNDQTLLPGWSKAKILSEIVIAVGATIIIPLAIH
jgi:hypothetical protein